jgi:hypothetical protein
MPTDVRILHVPDFLRTDAHGVPDLKATEEMLRTLTRRCDADNVHHILIDTRDADGRLLSMLDLYSLCRRFAELGFQFNHKLAIVNCPKDEFDRGAFVELVAGNRGWQVRAFRKIEPALDWLAAG